MDYEKIGKLIYDLRKEKGMTQLQLADALNISDKTVSKWERGLGCPDISLLRDLSAFFGVDMEKILGGNLTPNDFVGGNMKKVKYYVCPFCGNLTVCTGDAEISCCGRKLEPLEAVKTNEGINVEEIEDEWYITSDHPMKKDNYISFVAFATGDRLQVIKNYPEWDMQIRIPKRGHGMLLWYSTSEGLFYRLI